MAEAIALGLKTAHILSDTHAVVTPVVSATHQNMREIVLDRRPAIKLVLSQRKSYPDHSTSKVWKLNCGKIALVPI